MSVIVGFSGSARRPSRTRVLVETLVGSLARTHGHAAATYDLHDLGLSLRLADTIDGLDGPAQDVVTAIANADILVVGAPVYKGSYPGLFKHFFDLLPPSLLRGKTVLISAVGGGEKHALVVEHQLRPLFSFFAAHTVATSVYATEAELSGEAISSLPLLARINQAVADLAPRAGVDYAAPLARAAE